jgi:REP element-mobilizing transposase RayT
LRAARPIGDMTRAPRVELEGGIHHVTGRGVGRQPVFRDDFDRHRYLRLLAGVVRHTSWQCLSYCLMNNHVHLLVETPKPNLSEGMQRLHGGYAQNFNRRHKRVGHLFQDRFANEVVVDQRHFWNVLRYIAHNPVEAGLCATPEAWRWSSHAAILAGEAPTWLDRTRLYALVGADGGDPLRRYADLVKGV